ncbi:MAG: DNA (cytosine-5-)-methyltransferase [Oscillospiraceae bacterium]|nr:DNA (cytosine-5-)-methyltransferase [Oscillospiraceae bacterium]
MREILSGSISRYRKETGLTQEALAEHLGITFQAVSKWETGQTVPDTMLLPKLAQILNVSVDKLLGYPAGQEHTTFYENAYQNAEGYYWGVHPSHMCLKVVSLLPPDRRLKILDIGCGEGKDAVFFARCGYDVSAFDISSTGVEKTKRLAERAQVFVNVFKADINDYRLDCDYDILYQVGVFHYIKPELRDEIMFNYKSHVNNNGIAAFFAFVEKPFIDRPPEKEECFYPLKSGQLLTYFHDWRIEHSEECIFECNSSEIPHSHAANKVYARKIERRK